MELVSGNKLAAVADFLADDEVFGIAPCSHFNNSLTRNRVNVPCDIGDCEGDCPFYSKKNFIKWIKKPDSKYDVSNLKRPQQEDFIGYDNVSNSLLDKDGYIKALEEYCDNLGDALADAEYDFEEVADEVIETCKLYGLEKITNLKNFALAVAKEKKWYQKKKKLKKRVTEEDKEELRRLAEGLYGNDEEQVSDEEVAELRKSMEELGRNL